MKAKQPRWTPKEYKVVALRDLPAPQDMMRCETPDDAADYWRRNIVTCPYFNSAVESAVVIMVDTHRRVIGHSLISTGTLDFLFMHPRDVFRVAVIAASAAIVLMHNHPSGDPTPSDADIKVTRDMISAGDILKIAVLDHLVMGRNRPKKRDYVSLRELGYFPS